MVNVHNHHIGERLVQARLGVVRETPAFGKEVTPTFARFIEDSSLFAMGATDDDGLVWATVLAGPAGSARVRAGESISLSLRPPKGDALGECYSRPRPAGLLVLDPPSGRRVRVNGTVRSEGDMLIVDSEQAFRNCKKYIHSRSIHRISTDRPGRSSTTNYLTPFQLEMLKSADTFFLATAAQGRGSDCNHRGGRPGFVSANADSISWPDYPGNSFFMSFGNLELNERCGIALLDWESGDLLQVTGTAKVVWQSKNVDIRRVILKVVKATLTPRAVSVRWHLNNYALDRPGIQCTINPDKAGNT